MSTAIQILKKGMQLLYRDLPTGVCHRVIGPGGLSGEEEPDFSATVPAWESAANRFSLRFMFIGPGPQIPVQARRRSREAGAVRAGYGRVRGMSAEGAAQLCS